MPNRKLLLLMFTILILLFSRQHCYAATQNEVPQAVSIGVNSTGSNVSESLQVGSSGSKVVTVQCKLEMTNDATGKPYFTLPTSANYGNYGEVTKASAKKFQTDKGLTANGVVDISDNPDSTWKKMDLGKDEFILAKGSNDSNVVQLQQWLQSLDYVKVVSSGVFDTVTETAVNDYKDKKGLLNSGACRGKVGKTTWGYISNAVQSVEHIDDVSLKIGYYDIADAYVENGTTYANTYDVVHALKGHVEPYGHGTDNIVAVFYPTTGQNAYLKTAVTINLDEIDGYSVRKLAQSAGYGDKITYAVNADGSASVVVNIDNKPTDIMNAVVDGVKFLDECNTALLASGVPVFMGVGEGEIVVKEAGETVVKELSTLSEAMLWEKATQTAFFDGKAAEKYLAGMVGGTPNKYFRTNLGARFVDRYSEAKRTAYEAKVGYTSLTQFVKKQVLKDALILRDKDVKRAEWHFFRSAITGKIGATQQLLDFLAQNGIKYIIHQ